MASNIGSRQKRFLVLGGGLSGLLLLFWMNGCGGPKKITSSWDRAVISIDGDLSDWAGHLSQLEDLPLYLGVHNDNRFLYLCLKTTDRAMKRQINARGLSLWLDAQGGKEKNFGIRFPVGYLRMRAMRVGAEGENSEDSLRDFSDLESEAALVFVMLGANGEETVFEFNAVPELELKTERTVEGWGYEMKLPLRSSATSKLAFDKGNGSLLGIGLETGRAEGRRPDIRGNRSGGRARGGGPGGGRVGGGGGFGGRNNSEFGDSSGENRGDERGFQRPQTIKIWALVNLK